MARRVVHDPWLILTTMLLVASGLMMVVSSSSYVAMVDYGREPSSFGLRHAAHLLLGFVALVGCLMLPYQKLAEPWINRGLVVACFALLLLALAMPEIEHARRWIPVGPFNLQPSELSKLVAVVFLAALLARRQRHIRDPWAVLAPAATVIGAMGLLIVVEPDLGSAVVPVAVAGVMLFVAGLPWRYVLGGGLICSIAFGLAVLAKPYRVERMATFLDPWADAQGAGYQLTQSLIAFGNGGMLGVGLGDGQQRALFLPQPHTDFIYSIVGEDLGLLGCCLMLAGFLVLFWRGIRAAAGAPDRFGFYLALGLTCTLVIQALINMSVCLGLVPTKGLPLPFISYGGSSLVASMAAMGLLLNVSMYSNH